jgi:hypothetical protein
LLEKQIKALNLNRQDQRKIFRYFEKINLKNPKNDIIELGNLRNQLAFFEKNKHLDKNKTLEIRKTSQKITKHLEFLAFLKTNNFSKQAANSLLNQAKSLESQTEKKLNETSVSVFLDAKDKLKKAKENFENKKYFISGTYSLESRSLFKESLTLSH